MIPTTQPTGSSDIADSKLKTGVSSSDGIPSPRPNHPSLKIYIRGTPGVILISPGLEPTIRRIFPQVIFARSCSFHASPSSLSFSFPDVRILTTFRWPLTEGHCSCLGVLGDVSLYIPGTAEQPVSAELLGAGPDSKTTWELLPGKPTGTWTQSGFPLTGAWFQPSGRTDETYSASATLVSGPSDAVLIYTDDPISVTYSCAINGGISNCNAVWIDPTGTYSRSIQETVRPFLVQADANPSVTPPPSSGSRPSSTGPGTPANTGGAVQSNAAVRFGCGSIASGLVAVLTGVWLM